MTTPRYAPRWYRRRARAREELVHAAQTALLEPLVAEARLALCAPPPTAVFLDPLSRERIVYAASEWDRRGVALVGIDRDHVWIGTEFAALIIEDGGELCFELWGVLFGHLWHACVVARSEDAARSFALRIGASDVNVDGLAFDPSDLDPPGA